MIRAALRERAAGRGASLFILATAFLDVMAMGIVIPVLPNLILAFEGGDTADAALIGGLFGTAWAVMQLVAMPVLGALSDAYGRRPVLLLSITALGLDYVLMALAPNLWWLFAGRLLNGIFAASFSTASAYLADTTPPERRAAAFGMLGAAFGSGFVIGPALGGVLGEIDPRLPFWVAAALCLVNAAYGVFVLPESLPPSRRKPFALRGASVAGAFRFLGSTPGLVPLAAVRFLANLAHYVYPSVFVFYAVYRFGWSELLIGLTLAAVGVFDILIQGTLVGRLVKRFGERRVLIAGLCFGAAGLMGYALVPAGALFWGLMPVAALWGIANPALQALATQRVEPGQQGALQGAFGSVTSIGGMIGPLLFTSVFSAFLGKDGGADFPGAPFALASLLLVAAAALAWARAYPLPRGEAAPEPAPA